MNLACYLFPEKSYEIALELRSKFSIILLWRGLISNNL